jgi:hypothetical protein
MGVAVVVDGPLVLPDDKCLRLWEFKRFVLYTIN